MGKLCLSNPKIFLVMQLTAVFLMAAIMQVNAAAIYAQKINLNEKDASIERVFTSIEQQTNFSFLYDKLELKKASRVTVQLKDATLMQALEVCFKNQPLAYKIFENTIVVKEKILQKAEVIQDALPPVTVTGTVVDDKGETLPGVSVMIKGTTRATSTGLDGKFKITVDDDKAVLVFSYIGFKAKELAVGKNTNLKVELLPDTKQLNEVVVVGYGTQTKEEFTGSAARVSGEALKDVPVQSFDQGLAGRAAGVSIGQPNGVLNNAPVIRIRGVNSISLSSYPLVVVDGIPITTGNASDNTTVANNPLGDINPADIESIDVLKDAASTSIYGSRAAGGVLLITTKKGKQGKAKVTYEGWSGVTRAVRLPEMLNAEQYMMIKNEAVMNAKVLGGNANNPNVASALFFPTYREDGSLVSTNWYDHVYQNGVSQNHSLSVAGGSDATRYYFSANYSNQNGILKTNEFTRKAARFNIDHKLASWINLSGNVNYNNTLNASPSTGSLSGNAFGLVGSARLAWLTAPNVYAVNPDGSYNINIATNSMGMGNNQVQSNFYNPVPLLDLNKFTSENDHIIANFTASATLLKGLNLKTYYAMDNTSIENISFQNALHGAGATSQGSAANVIRRINSWNWTNTLNYSRVLGAKHSVSGLLGYDIQKSNTNGWGATRTQSADAFFTDYQGNFGAVTVPAGSIAMNEWALVSYFSRLTYDFDKKYFLTLNYRKDGNSRLGAERKWGDFGGVSGGWTLSEEEFYKKSKLFDIANSVKLRASWGRVGNASLSNSYGSLNLFESSLYGSNTTWAYSQAGNPDLGWETSKQTNIGADVGFLNNRFQLEATYFNNNVDGLILSVPQSPSKGIPGNAILMNVGAMYNRGLELGLNAFLISKKKFSWNSNINFTSITNKVTDLYGEGSEIVGTTSTAAEATNITRVGYSVGSLYGAKTDGVNPANGQRIFINGKGERVQYSHVVPSGGSRWTYLDGTPAPAIGVNDYYLIGNALPKWYGGINNSFKYGNFDMGINFTFSGGNYVMNGSKATWRDQRFWNNSTEVLERWTTPGQVTDVPRVVYGDLLSNGSSWPISENAEKADFLRLQTASIGYRFPAKVLGKAGISSVRIYGQVYNAFILTKYSGTDPEISVNGNSNTTPGVEKNSVPQGRTFTVGLNVGF
ncbi:TonB-dependent receptor [Pedobacter sp. SYSU D00535]|uniref:TonB-dependent receptor n=1 Tax=Pedobacter sp. SYSU D00535 TaxID=2810308 RepID=UPI001F603B99|nr:TonB-dependent receptor [Pedobacter sp. SYSU D00535]